MVVAATGFFDGVHLGHRIILDKVRSVARERGEESVAVTFRPHPRNVLQQDADRLRLLNSLEEKKSLIMASGIDRVVVLPFDREFSSLSAEEFIRRYLVERLGVSGLILGYDHRFGHGAGCDVSALADVVRKCGVEPVICDRYVMPDGTPVSSTAVRKALDSCQVERAAEMLGYGYSLSGVVVSGNRIGRTLGFPTANMELYDPLKVVPGNGVYQVEVKVCGASYRGVCNIGVRPTVGSGGARVIETHILDFDEDIYGLDIQITFRRYIRPERKFGSLEELKARLHQDILTVNSL